MNESDYIDNKNENHNLGSEIFNTQYANSSELSFYNLNIVHVDYMEMRRMFERIRILNVEMILGVAELFNSLNELASLVDYKLNVDDLGMNSIGLKSNFDWNEEDDFSGLSYVDAVSSEYILGLSDNISNALKIMNSQMVKYQEQTEITDKQIAELNEMVQQIINNPNLSYYDTVDKKNVDISYNEWLHKYKKAELLNNYGIVDFDELMVTTNNSNTVNIYNYIEQNLQNEMKLLGVSTGKEYLRYILDDAEKNATNNREKAVCGALALNKFLGDNNITANYGYGSGHANFSIDDLSSGTDCSSYVSILVKEGNPNFSGGGTGAFLSDYTNISSVNIDDILPGDILTSSSHARFVVGVDKDTNTIITAENVNYGVGSVIRRYSINDLINSGYKTYHVNYDS